VDRSARHEPGASPKDRFPHIAKVRVAGSNPVIRSNNGSSDPARIRSAGNERGRTIATLSSCLGNRIVPHRTGFRDTRPEGSVGSIIAQLKYPLPGGDRGLTPSVVLARVRHGSSAWQSPNSQIDLVASISRDVRPRKRLSGSPRWPPGQV
jgi:hypothetical protein